MDDKLQVSRDEAVRTLQVDRDDRTKKCGEELNTVLQKYRCSLVSQQVLINGMPKSAAEITVVAND